MTVNFTNSTNVTGWNKLIDGEIAEAVYEVSNVALAGNILLLLYVAVSVVIMWRAKNPTILAILSMIFLVLFNTYLTDLGIKIIIVVTLFSIAAAIAKAFFETK